jgi:hypothetical protein
MLQSTAILTLSAVVHGKVREYATDAAASAAVERFGRAVNVERVTDAHGVQLLVTCATQRGDGGAFQMHHIACNFGIPVHVA